ncbi:hypothetical protein [Paenibacillus donghaensis]|uniref:Uncharacterized protein n=1 Tax=Paenibacillus donghaensis TaxID=414771 RepID=A0A2Z2KJE1_9BACL|nr:hypothetical protein [Paenibacillus donghaensis]ASA24305.1 hypothetical protein B9T62_28205 [Paenibacillus donghaensis]
MRSDWIRRLLLPRHAARAKELRRASVRVTLTISQYQNVSQEIQEEIKHNRFAKYLIYDRGEHHGHD